MRVFIILSAKFALSSLGVQEEAKLLIGLGKIEWLQGPPWVFAGGWAELLSGTTSELKAVLCACASLGS